ncbi:MAG TPA: hypothetical protein VEF33_10265 [Syntrophales bacterium]|nr:hypothetical protein [Syntrophales bacterium]
MKKYLADFGYNNISDEYSFMIMVRYFKVIVTVNDNKTKKLIKKAIKNISMTP